MFDELEYENEDTAYIDDIIKSFEKMAINSYIRQLGKCCSVDDIAQDGILVGTGICDSKAFRIYFCGKTLSFALSYQNKVYMLHPKDLAKLADINGVFADEEVQDDNQ